MRMTARDDHRRPTGADLPADQLGLGDLGDRCVDAFIEQPLPPPCPRKRLDEGAVRLRLVGGDDSAPVGGDDALAAPAALESHRDVEDQPNRSPPAFAALADQSP